MYLILMNPNTNERSTYKGAICVIDGKPWYVTNLQRPDIYASEGEANKVIRKLARFNKAVEFIVVSVGAYVNMIDDNILSKWVAQLKMEQLEL